MEKKILSGIRIKMLRTEKDLTQEQLASLIGVERSTVGKYESPSDPVVPSNEVLIKLADLFDTTTDYILGRTEIKKAPATIEGYEDLSEDKRLTIDAVLQMSDEQARAFRNLFEQFQANQENEK